MAMPRKIRIGAVCYLNTEPLVRGLARGLGAERIELSEDVPSRLAERMAREEIDVALLPVIELAGIPDLEVVPGLSIRTFGPARSVLLVCRRPAAEVERLALDPESRTSNVLARVLLAEVWGRRPDARVGPLELDRALAEHDAVVRIGDKALFEPPGPDLEVHDLGEVWTRATGLPFVFAVWAARRGVVDAGLYRLLHASRREGARAIESIAAEFRWNGRHDPQRVRDYLGVHIGYRLGSAELRAIRLFLDSAARLGLAPEDVPIRLALQRRTECHDLAERLQLARGDAPGG